MKFIKNEFLSCWASAFCQSYLISNSSGILWVHFRTHGRCVRPSRWKLFTIRVHTRSFGDKRKMEIRGNCAVSVRLIQGWCPCDMGQSVLLAGRGGMLVGIWVQRIQSDSTMYPPMPYDCISVVATPSQQLWSKHAIIGGAERRDDTQSHIYYSEGRGSHYGCWPISLSDIHGQVRQGHLKGIVLKLTFISPPAPTIPLESVLWYSISPRRGSRVGLEVTITLLDVVNFSLEGVITSTVLDECVPLIRSLLRGPIE
jgi:hypothetical protein